MANERDDGEFDEFVRIWARWSSYVPAALSRQDPSTLARLLNLGLREGGISQTNLQRELGMNQPRLSKLMKKLVRAGWIRVKRSKTDSRIRLTTTTVTARDRVNALKQDLETLLRAQRPAQPPASVPQRSRPATLARGKPIEVQPGQTQFDLGE